MILLQLPQDMLHMCMTYAKEICDVWDIIKVYPRDAQGVTVTGVTDEECQN